MYAYAYFNLNEVLSKFNDVCKAPSSHWARQPKPSHLERPVSSCVTSLYRLDDDLTNVSNNILMFSQKTPKSTTDIKTRIAIAKLPIGLKNSMRDLDNHSQREIEEIFEM